MLKRRGECFPCLGIAEEIRHTEYYNDWLLPQERIETGTGMVLSNDPDITAAVFITYIVIFSQIIPPAKTFAAGFYSIQKGMASAERIFEVLDADEVIEECAKFPLGEHDDTVDTCTLAWQILRKTNEVDVDIEEDGTWDVWSDPPKRTFYG